MKITKIELVREAVAIDADVGKFSITGHIYFLQAGVAQLIWPGSKPLPKVEVPPLEDKPERTVDGTTDPILVCLARRNWSFTNPPSGVFGTLQDDNFPIPTYVEAVKELHSGTSLYGGEWPAPRLPATDLTEALAEAARKA